MSEGEFIFGFTTLCLFIAFEVISNLRTTNELRRRIEYLEKQVEKLKSKIEDDEAYRQSTKAKPVKAVKQKSKAMKNEHTPGPWKATKDKDTYSLGPWRVENNDDLVSIIDYNENVFAYVQFTKANPKDGILFPIDANVRLITAAPTMLSKLKELSKIMSNVSKLQLLNGPIGTSLYHDLCSLNRLIAKIEGDE